MSTSRRIILGAAALLGVAVLLNVVGLVVDRLAGGEVVPGPDGSSYVTTATGWAAYHDLLEQSGHPVTRLEEPVRPGILDPATTLVIASPDTFALDDRQMALIGQFVDAGGRLIVSSTSLFGDLATTLLDPPPVLGGVPSGTMTPVFPVPETKDVEIIAVSGLYAWADTGSALPVVGRDGAAVVAVASIGEGRLIALADPAILSNVLLDEADNAALGLAITGEPGRPVVFNEYVHGYGGASALAALPDGWAAALLLGLGAAVVWLWSIGSRFAPAEPSDRAFPPSRGLYVDALAASIARAQDAPQASTSTSTSTSTRSLLKHNHTE